MLWKGRAYNLDKALKVIWSEISCCIRIPEQYPRRRVQSHFYFLRQLCNFWKEYENISFMWEKNHCPCPFLSINSTSVFCYKHNSVFYLTIFQNFKRTVMLPWIYLSVTLIPLNPFNSSSAKYVPEILHCIGCFL